MKLNVIMKGRDGSYDAKGVYDGKKLVVLKGSKIKNRNFSNRSNIINEIRNNKNLVKNNLVCEDITFNSASTAANFVADAICNGLRYWRDEKGVSLKELLSSKK